jgi:hypothetical protein
MNVAHQTLESVAGKPDLDDFARREILRERAAHAGDVQHARIVGSQRRPQRPPKALVASHVVFAVPPAHLEIFSLREIAALGPQPGGDVRTPDRDPRVHVVGDQIDRDARFVALRLNRIRRRCGAGAQRNERRRQQGPSQQRHRR